MKSVPKSIWLSQDLFHQFPWSTNCLIVPAEFPSAAVEGWQLQHRVQSLWRQRQAHLCCCVVTGNALGKCQFVVDRSTRLGAGDYSLSFSWIYWRGQLSLTSFSWVCSSPGALGLGGLQGYTAWSLQALISACGHWTLDSRQWCWYQGQKGEGQTPASDLPSKTSSCLSGCPRSSLVQSHWWHFPGAVFLGRKTLTW